MVMNRTMVFKIIENAVQNYSGNVDQLNGAIGMFFMGYYFGWNFLYIAFNKRTIAKYEKILGIDVRHSFESIGLYSPMSEGLYQANKYSNFWKVVSGDIKISDRKTLLPVQDACKRYHLPASQ